MYTLVYFIHAENANYGDLLEYAYALQDSFKIFPLKLNKIFK